MKRIVFRGSGVAIVTPMNPDSSINYVKLAELIEFQIAGKTDSIVICGTTGEASTMSDKEQVECIRFCVEKVAGRIPVVAGVGSNNTAHAVWLSKQAKDAGADALLHVTPYYNKATPLGIVRHMTVCADATDLPVILYNVPSRTGLNIKPSTYVELAKHPNIVATKEANSNIEEIAQTRALVGDNLNMYSGNDDQIVPIMSLGGLGVISVLANIMPRETHDICELFETGRAKESVALQLRLLPLIKSLFIEVNPIPVKEALNLMGYDVGIGRLPLCGIGAEAREVLRTEMTAAGLIR